MYDSNTSQEPTASNRRGPKGPEEGILRHARGCGKTPGSKLSSKMSGPLSQLSMLRCDGQTAHHKVQWTSGNSVLANTPDQNLIYSNVQLRYQLPIQISPRVCPLTSNRFVIRVAEIRIHWFTSNKNSWRLKVTALKRVTEDANYVTRSHTNAHNIRKENKRNICGLFVVLIG